MPGSGKERSHSSRGDVREHLRKPLRGAGVVRHKAGQSPVTVKDMSKGGVRLELPDVHRDMALDGPLSLDLRSLGKIRVSVKWRDGTTLGAAFEPRQHEKLHLTRQIEQIMRR